MKYIRRYTNIINEYNNQNKLNNFHNITINDIITNTYMTHFKKTDEYNNLYEEFEYDKNFEDN
jgi:hypothetical protein